MTIMVLNGPNLNLLGKREPEIYGKDTLGSIEAELKEIVGDIDFRQTNDEGELINWIHEAIEKRYDVIINPAAFTHYSYGLADACAMLKDFDLKLIEVHISNPHARENFRHKSVISPVATGVIAGFGKDSYKLALKELLQG
ncbi:MAG: type II 3-dehydroquinate dehydratase [Micrococcaceae bacterium]